MTIVCLIYILQTLFCHFYHRIKQKIYFTVSKGYYNKWRQLALHYWYTVLIIIWRWLGKTHKNHILSQLCVVFTFNQSKDFCFSFSLATAITGCLCPYRAFPHDLMQLPFWHEAGYSYFRLHSKSLSLPAWKSPRHLYICHKYG